MTKSNDALAMESGRRIRDARVLRGWTQKQLSQAMGWRETEGRLPAGALTPAAVGNYEQGKRRVGWEEALTLSKVLSEFPPAYYMGVITEDEARLIAAMPGNRPRRQPPFASDRPVTPRRQGGTT